jgi:hypothetical protein
MADDDEAARKARAESLRQQIARLKPNQTKAVEESEDDSEPDSSDPGSEKQAADKEAPSGESPREFVQRKMRELDNKT